MINDCWSFSSIQWSVKQIKTCCKVCALRFCFPAFPLCSILCLSYILSPSPCITFPLLIYPLLLHSSHFFFWSLPWPHFAELVRMFLMAALYFLPYPSHPPAWRQCFLSELVEEQHIQWLAGRYSCADRPVSVFADSSATGAIGTKDCQGETNLLPSMRALMQVSI